MWGVKTKRDVKKKEEIVICENELETALKSSTKSC